MSSKGVGYIREVEIKFKRKRIEGGEKLSSISNAVTSEDQIKVGDYFEDCAYHPCVVVSIEMGCVNGISLVDGSYPRNCGILQCDLRILTLEEVVQWKFHGPPDVPPEIEIEEKRKWWIQAQEQLKKDHVPIP